MCTCSPECPAKPSHMDAAVMPDSLDGTSDETQPVRECTYQQKEQLRKRLLDFREHTLTAVQEKCEEQSIQTGIQFAADLPVGVVDSIVENCQYIDDVVDLEGRCTVQCKLRGDHANS